MHKAKPLQAFTVEMKLLPSSLWVQGRPFGGGAALVACKSQIIKKKKSIKLE